MHERTVCTAVNRKGRDCDAVVPTDAPVSLCMTHLIRAYVYINDRLAEQDTQAALLEWAKPEPERSVVYYVRFGDRVKIGTTTQLKTRLVNVPHDEVLAVEPGGFELERQRHNQFATHHVVREWFGVHPELMAHAMRVRLAHPELVPTEG